ncbi:MAG: hypothetical protein ABI254_07855, partial [Chthoniobacterales bacterium]
MKTRTNKLLLITGIVSLLLLTLPSLHSAAIPATWSGGTATGTYTWETASNWTPSANYPSGGQGGNTFSVTIGDATGDRVITTSGAISLTGIQLTQSSSGGSSTLKLGGNLSLTGSPVAGGITNSTSDPAKIVIDLNGFNFTNSLNAIYFASGGNYTVRSTAVGGGGTFGGNLSLYGDNNLHVENSVTIEISTGVH